METHWTYSQPWKKELRIALVAPPSLLNAQWQNGAVVEHNIYVSIVFNYMNHSGKFPFIRKGSIEEGVIDFLQKGINNMLTSNLDKVSVKS